MLVSRLTSIFLVSLVILQAPCLGGSQSRSDSAIQNDSEKQIENNKKMGKELLSILPSELDAVMNAQQALANQKTEAGIEAASRACIDKQKIVAKTINLLDRIHENGAINIFVDHLGFEDDNYPSEHTNRLHFPCLGALIHFGLPAVDALATRIANDPNKESFFQDGGPGRYLAALIAINVMGRSCAVAYLQARVVENNSPTQKAKLTSWISTIQNLPDVISN